MPDRNPNNHDSQPTVPAATPVEANRPAHDRDITRSSWVLPWRKPILAAIIGSACLGLIIGARSTKSGDYFRFTVEVPGVARITYEGNIPALPSIDTSAPSGLLPPDDRDRSVLVASLGNF